MKKYERRIDTELMSAVEVYKLVLSGNLKTFPHYFWTENDSNESAKNILTYLIEEVLNWTEEDIKGKYTAEVLIEYKLRGMMMQCFNSSPFKALDNAYPGRFLPWELINTPLGFWTDDNCKKAIKWLLEEKLNWMSTDPPRKVTNEDFKNNCLSGMMERHFDNSPYKAINLLYPGRFKEWEVTNSGKGFWNREKGIEAARWLFDTKLKWSEKEVIERVTSQTFVDNDFNGMFVTCFDGSPYKVIEALYPGKYEKRDMKFLPNGYWTKETAIKEIRDLFDNRLKWSRNDIAQKLNSKTLIKNGFYANVFNNSAIAAVNAAYPGEFKEWEFKKFKRIEWTKEKLIEAVKWLIESRLKWSEEEVKKKISCSTFVENDLYRVIELYNFNPFKAVMEAYPGKYEIWEFKRVPGGFWNQETGVQATKWLIEKKLHWNDQDIKNKISRKIFEENGLGGMLQLCFKKNIYRTINSAYPNKFRREDIKFLSRGKIDTSQVKALNT